MKASTATSVHSNWRKPKSPNIASAGRSLGSASPRSSRAMKTMPRPLSMATHGRIAGSAYGAKNRTTEWARIITAMNSAGITTADSPISCSSAACTPAVNTTISTPANRISSSSLLRRVGTRRPAPAPEAAGLLRVLGGRRARCRLGARLQQVLVPRVVGGDVGEDPVSLGAVVGEDPPLDPGPGQLREVLQRDRATAALLRGQPHPGHLAPETVEHRDVPVRGRPDVVRRLPAVPAAGREQGDHQEADQGHQPTTALRP